MVKADKSRFRRAFFSKKSGLKILIVEISKKKGFKDHICLNSAWPPHLRKWGFLRSKLRRGSNIFVFGHNPPYGPDAPADSILGLKAESR